METMQKWDSMFLEARFYHYPRKIRKMKAVSIYSEIRSDYGIKKQKKCPFDDTEEYHFCELEKYLSDFHVLANKYPITRHHFVMPHKEHIHMNDIRNLEEHLEQMNILAKATGMTIFHNSPDAGASIPCHEHYQGFLCPTPFDELHRGQKNLPDYPGLNAVFSTAGEAAENVPETAYNTIITCKEIVIVPRKCSYSLTLERPFGGAEIIGMISWSTNEKAKNVTNSELEQGFDEVLLAKP